MLAELTFGSKLYQHCVAQATFLIYTMLFFPTTKEIREVKYTKDKPIEKKNRPNTSTFAEDVQQTNKLFVSNVAMLYVSQFF